MERFPRNLFMCGMKRKVAHVRMPGLYSQKSGSSTSGILKANSRLNPQKEKGKVTEGGTVLLCCFRFGKPGPRDQQHSGVS